MGNIIKRVCENFKCRSSCSLNEESIEMNQIKNDLAKINYDDLKALYEIHKYREWLYKEEQKKINNRLRTSVGRFTIESREL